MFQTKQLQKQSKKYQSENKTVDEINDALKNTELTVHEKNALEAIKKNKIAENELKNAENALEGQEVSWGNYENAKKAVDDAETPSKAQTGVTLGPFAETELEKKFEGLNINEENFLDNVTGQLKTNKENVDKAITTLEESAMIGLKKHLKTL